MNNSIKSKNYITLKQNLYQRKPKMKVAVVIPTHFDIRSSLHVLLSAYRYLIRTKNIEVTIFTDSRNNVSYKDFKIEKIKSVDYKTPLEKIFFIMGIPRFFYMDLIKKLKGYDVIETSNPEFYWFAYQSYLAAKKYKIGLVYRTSQTVDGFFLFHLTRHIIRLFVRKAYDYAQALIFTNTEAVQRCIRLGFINNSKKVMISGHGVDTKIFKPNKKTKHKNIILLSVAGLYKIKGHHLIIKSLKKVIDSGYRNVRLHIVGEGYYKNHLIELSKHLGINNYVKFLGTLDSHKLVLNYNQSDIFVLANYQEITPAVNEAMASGLPVVVMECGGRKFTVPNEEYGLVSKKFDTDDMAKKIILLIKNPELRKKIADKGRKRVIEKFRIEVYADNLYKGLKRKTR